MVRKPARLIYLVLVIALFAITLLGGGEAGGAARDARELPALAGAFCGLMFVILVSAGFKNGASMFTLSDVNLLFPAPIRPRAVLYYGLFRQLGASLLLGLFLLFQYGWLHSLYGVGVGILILIVVLYGVSVFLAQVVAMAAYSLTSMSPRRRALVEGLIYGVLGAFLVAVLARAALAPGGMSLSSLVDAADSPLFRLMPVAGWTAAMLRLSLIHILSGRALLRRIPRLCQRDHHRGTHGLGGQLYQQPALVAAARLQRGQLRACRRLSLYLGGDACASAAGDHRQRPLGERSHL